MNTLHTTLRTISLFIISIGCAFGIVYTLDAFGLLRIHSQQASVQTAENTIPTGPEIIDTPREIRMMFVGDMMMDRGVKNSVMRNFNGDYARLFEFMDIFQEADIVFGNLEGPVSDQGKNVGSIYSFRMDPKIIPAMVTAGFDIVSLANNHAGDWSLNAFTDSLKRLQENNIQVTGVGSNYTQAIQPVIIEHYGMKIGFLGFTDVGPEWLRATETKAGLLSTRDPQYEKIISDASNQVDTLIVTIHWGDEYKPHANRQKELGRKAIDAGARFVIGHHPHVIQDIEYYNDGLIAYSLGNFIFDQYFSQETMQGLLVDITLRSDNTFSLRQWLIPISRQYQPQTPIEVFETPSVGKQVSVPPLCPKNNQSMEDKTLFPVSRTRGLGMYIPGDLIPMENRMDVRTTASCLRKDAGMALQEMASESFKAGLRLVMTSGFRDAQTQKTLYERNLQNNPNQPFPSVAEPGHSEHQLGTVVDFKTATTMNESYRVFGNTPEYIWLINHAHRFGFVQSYPEGKEEITGYMAEPWHWRYVGIEHATAIKNQGITLIEYLEKL